jgi:general stress protein YciG
MARKSTKAKRVTAGRKGGKKVVKKYGKGHMRKIGKKGGRETARLASVGKRCVVTVGGRRRKR